MLPETSEISKRPGDKPEVKGRIACVSKLEQSTQRLPQELMVYSDNVMQFSNGANNLFEEMITVKMTCYLGGLP